MRFTRVSTFLFISLLTVNSAFAQFSMGVDLREWMGPVRNQSNKGWCYANAASDLLSYHFLAPQKGQSASAVFTALSYISEYIEGGNGVVDGGNVHRAVMAAKEIGVCPRSYDEALLARGWNIGNLKAKLDFISKLYDEKIDIEKKREEGSSNHELEMQFQHSMDRLKDSNSVLAPLLHEFSDSEITRFVENTPKEKFYFNLAKQVCGKNRELIRQKFNVYTANFLEGNRVSFPVAAEIQGPTRILDPGKNLFYAERSYDAKIEKSRFTLPNGFGFSRPSVLISSFLDQHVPVAISYYSAFLRTNYLDTATTLKQFDKLLRDPHASVIVAERKDPQTGKKELLIRNSWGESCMSYHSVIQKDHCERGHIWVPEDVLNLFVYSITAIDFRQK